MAASDAATPSLVDRVQDFIAEHKHAVILGTAAAALAVGGAAYYAASSSRGGSAADSDVEKGGAGRKDRKKGSKKRKSTKDRDGPILEERKGKVVEEAEDVVLSAQEIEGMSTEERTSTAASLKARGNAAYQQRKFAVAADLYTRAIEVSAQPEPVFYSNRAACFINMQPPRYESVVEDCDSALQLDKNYVKALNRRATALEHLGRYEESLRDFTACTILEKFQNTQSSNAVERVLKALSSQRAAEILAKREPRLPSYTFISAYFAAFRKRPPFYMPPSPSQGDETLALAQEALDAADYAHALTLVNEALDQGLSSDQTQAEALNLRGTFKFLIGDVAGAKTDLLASVDRVPGFTQSLVKLASVHMEQGSNDEAFECFEEAIRHNPDDPDIYYHRGQVHFIMEKFDEAAADYTKSTELDDKFVFSHIQLAVAQYKSNRTANSMATFRRTLKAFPDRSEPPNYYGELLLDQGRFSDAIEKFDRAIELERQKSPPTNVLPLVNKGLALFQWKQDVGGAERCCNEALRIDGECEAAVATLAQLYLQMSKVDKAIEMFERQAQLARSEVELQNALTYQYASIAQLTFMNEYPHMKAQLSQMARTMG